MKVAIVQISAIAAAKDYVGYNFEQHKAEFGLAYSGTENSRREKIFNENLERVQVQNAMFTSGNSSWHAAMNKFSVLDRKEFAATMLGRAHYPNMHHSLLSSTVADELIPTSVDWRKSGIVSPVKDQGQCGSCWAFASTEVIESRYMLESSEKGIVLAPQYFVNCVKNPDECGGTGGCSGAIAQLAFNLTSQKGKGIPLEKDLPYTGRDGTCGTYPPRVSTNGWNCIKPNDARELQIAIANTGSVAVSVAANGWDMYSGGIFVGGCSEDDCVIDHAVVAVGYSTEYWLIRNSWSAEWGEAGYIRLSRVTDKYIYHDTKPADGTACKPYPKVQLVGGECGVLSQSCYPTNVKRVEETVTV